MQEPTTPQYLKRVNAALTLREIPDHEAALDQLKKALDEKPDSAEVYLTFGILYRDRDDYHRAESAFRKALGLEPDNELVRATLAGLLFDMGNLEETLKLLRPLIERNSHHPLVWRHYARAFFADKGEDRLLRRVLDEAAVLDGPALEKILAEMRPVVTGHYPLPTEDAESLLGQVNELLEKHPGNVGLLEMRQRALRALNRYDEALSTLKELEALGEPHLHWDFFEVYHALGDQKHALAYVENTGVEWSISDLYVVHEVAETLSKLGRVSQAGNALAQVVKKRPPTGQWVFYSMPILIRAKRYDEAEELLDRMADEGIDEYLGPEGPDEIGPTFSRGYLYLARGESERAIEHFEALDPEQLFYAEAFPPIPVVYDGELQEPLPLTEDFYYLGLVSHQELVLSALAIAYLVHNDLDRSLTMAKRAITLESATDYTLANIAGYTALGSVQQARGDAKAAREAWEVALKRAKEARQEEAAEFLSGLLSMLDEQT